MTEYQSIELLIKAEPHILKIEPAEQWKSLDINPLIFCSESRDYAMDYIEGLKYFLNLPYIIDDFDSHNVRNEWKTDMFYKYGIKSYEYLNTNVLKGANSNVVNHCISEAINSKTYVGSNNEEFEKRIKELSELNQQLSKATHLDCSTPIDLIKTLKQKVYCLLEFLSCQTPIY